MKGEHDDMSTAHHEHETGGETENTGAVDTGNTGETPVEPATLPAPDTVENENSGEGEGEVTKDDAIAQEGRELREV